ncbi:MAG: hypothetical protein M5U14_20620 [Acidimicrobiia bacterium]|nr:hypothetical protein [Acidimicrobiia bacterium]
MADSTTTGSQTTRAPQRSGPPEPYPESPWTGWMGWNVFAAVMLMIGGTLQALWGFIAVVNDEWVVWGNRANLYIDLSTWGWVHLGIGAVVFLAGLGVLTGNVLARAVGVALAAASLVANFLSLPAYPVWAITVMTVDVIVIWALTAHGHEMRDRTREVGSGSPDGSW